MAVNLFELLGTVAIDSSGAKRALDETTEKAAQSESKISNAFEKIGSAAVKVGKTIATGLAAGTAAVTALTKSALEGYADYEQLVGGVETLFGAGGQSLEEYAESVGKTVDEVADEYNKMLKAEETVLNNADKAYRTAGLSANDYMETVTSFSASLIQSLNGDTEAAAEKANQAIVDMSDNANKMGTSMTMIQNAYQGFAKQNYTMLDNLKLGYGGTQEEMYRLMQDAAKLDSTFAENAVFSLDSKGSLDAKYSDIVDAIHIIQTEMRITGTTAKEASSTISGSFSSMKAAWSNLVAGLGKEDVDLTGLINQFTDSADTVLDNVMPRIEAILGGMTELISQIVPKIAKRLPELLRTTLPSLIEAVVQLFNGLVAALPTILQILIEQMPYIVSEIAKGLVDAFPVLLETVKTLFGQIWNYISFELQKNRVIFEDALTKINEVFNAVWSAMQQIWADIGQPIWNAIEEAFQRAWAVLQGAWLDIGKPIFDKISAAMKEVSGVGTGIYEKFVEIIKQVVENYLNNLIWKFETIVEVFKTVFLPVAEMVIGTVIDLAKSIIENVVPAVVNIMRKFNELSALVRQVVTEHIVPMVAKFVDMVKELWEENRDKLNLIGELFGTIFNTIAENVGRFIENFKNKFIPFLEFIRDFASNNMDKIKETFQNAIDFITGIVQFFIAFFKGDWEGMWEAVKATLKAAIDFVNGIFETLEEFLRTILERLGEEISTEFNEIRDSITEKLTDAKDKVVEIFDNIKSSITEKIEAAKENVSNVIEKIKGLFNFEWSLPSVPMPHFSVSPSGWQIGDLLKGSIPSLGVEWYAEGGVLEKPTVFGLNGNNAMIGGEAGAEAVAPIDVLQKYVAQAVASQNAGLIAVLQQILDAIISMDENMGDNVSDALAGTGISLNNREFARLVKAVN